MYTLFFMQINGSFVMRSLVRLTDDERCLI